MQSNISFLWNTLPQPLNRVRVYIDWFNFYHNLKTFYPNRKHYQWLDYRKLIQNQLSENDIIKAVYFFTAYYSDNVMSERYKRHKNLNKALSVCGVNTIYGTFISKEKTVYVKQITKVRPWDHANDLEHIDEIDYKTKEEKKTDVNIAVKLVEDAYENYFDTAYIISCDTDLIPAIELIKRKFPTKKLINVRIANSVGRDIQRSCHDLIELSGKMITDATMDYTIVNSQGETISIPLERLPGESSIFTNS